MEYQGSNLPSCKFSSNLTFEMRSRRVGKVRFHLNRLTWDDDLGF